jgi:hypothetical protein
MDDKTKNELLALSSNFGEIALDSILSDGIFRDIPVVGSLISLSKLTYSISDYFLLTRIIHFVNELDLKSQSDIDELKIKYFKDDDYIKIGSKILLAIEKSDDQRKLKWLAKCFRLLLDKQISKSTFMRLTSIINNVFAEDIEQILIFNQRKEITSSNDIIETYVLDQLFSAGLLESRGFDGGDISGNNSGTIYALNNYGKIIMEKLLK